MFKVEIDTGNAAFEEGHDELARIIRKLGEDIHTWRDTEGALFDYNGNRVGTYWSEDDE